MFVSWCEHDKQFMEIFPYGLHAQYDYHTVMRLLERERITRQHVSSVI